MSKRDAVREVMFHDKIGPARNLTAVVCTYRTIKGTVTKYKTLVLSGQHDAHFYEWRSEAQAAEEHFKAVAHYKRLQ